MNRSCNKAPRPSPDGFIVVAVLWILAALATLATIYAVYVTNTAAALSVNDDQLKAEALVTAGLELTVHQLTAASELPPRGSFGFRLGGATMAVDFQTESGRVDLNAASKELLAGLFASLGVPRETAENYADRIIAWRAPPTEGQDKEASDYRMAGLKYPPRGAKFPHVDELSLVLGLPPELVERAIPFLTVYSGQAGINVLAAAPQVLGALPGMSPDRLYAILAQRQTARPDTAIIASLLGSSQSYATTESNRSMRVNIRIRFDNGRQMSSEVVVLLIDDSPEPYQILSWRDAIDYASADAERRPGSR
jgi:general secretion pathway protein K